MKIKHLYFYVFFLFLACQPTVDNKGRIQIVCTTGMIGDMVSNIIGNQADVVSIMGPGVDPHLYKASRGDLSLLSNADIIIYNGVHLEGKMGSIFEKLKNRKLIYKVADGLEESDLINNSDFVGAYDPHIWFDLNLWSKACLHLTEELSKVEGLSKDSILTQGKTYAQEILRMSQWVKDEIQSIPKPQRVLITAHDAFSYFGKAYDIEVKGLQGISTASEYGLRDLSDLVNFIVQRNIQAVFVESSVSRKALEAVIRGCKEKGHHATIGGTLYGDAMGEKETKEAFYLGMVKHNVNTIVAGLKKETYEK